MPPRFEFYFSRSLSLPAYLRSHNHDRHHYPPIQQALPQTNTSPYQLRSSPYRLQKFKIEECTIAPPLPAQSYTIGWIILGTMGQASEAHILQQNGKLFQGELAHISCSYDRHAWQIDRSKTDEVSESNSVADADFPLLTSTPSLGSRNSLIVKHDLSEPDLTWKDSTNWRLSPLVR